MKPFSSSENDEQDQEVIKHLQDLGASEPEYPAELLAARRAAFLARVEQLRVVDAGEELAPGDRQMIKVLGALKAAEAEYPQDLLAARRSTFLQQIGRAKNTSLLDRARVSLQGVFLRGVTMPSLPLPGVGRTSLVVASLIAAALVASLLFSQLGQSLKLSPSQSVGVATRALPTSIHEVAMLICKPDDLTPCPPVGLDPSQDLADQANGVARPAVSNDASSGAEGVHQAGYVNDGRSGASWVSKSAYSWIKIDLGKVTTINSISLQKGSLGSSPDNNLGQFVIAVALSDVYSDGNTSNDYTEYAQVFNSEQTGFNGMVSHTETIRTLFPPVKARYVKITFEKAGAAIDEVGVFMVQPPVLIESPTARPKDEVPELTSTLAPTNALVPVDTATSVPTDTPLPTDTPSAIPTEPWTASPTNTLPPTAANTPTALPTDTLPPADTPTPVPTKPLPSATPIPTSTAAPPTAIPPTAIPPTVQLPSASTDPIIITGSDQTLTFTCNDNAVVLRGHANTITLLGSCSSITVTGNGNRVFWQFGSPVITNKGQQNIISQQ